MDEEICRQATGYGQYAGRSVSGDDRAGETPRVIEFAIVRKGLHEGCMTDPLRKIMRKRFAGIRPD
ncbi:hypothetical protein [Burkholderia ambifaria]|uniref:hypothetical protein n=1 Tax=Burkholderia ambifaria TaxID=152480 RepID=UPI001589130F|nr:hypothetical protein [Burkholderia ambifaria]